MNLMQWLTWLKGGFITLIGSYFLKLVGLAFAIVVIAAFHLVRSSAIIGAAITELSDFGMASYKHQVFKGSTFFKKIRNFKPVVKDMRWMTVGELSRLMIRLVRILGAQPALWMVLASRLTRLWKLGGTRFTISYLKECRLALLAWANHSAYAPNPGVKVRLTSSGIPCIIPSGLRPRSLTSSADKMLFRGLHTVFNLYRVMDWKGAKPDFSSITNGFSGVSQTLFSEEISAVLKYFSLPTFRLGYVSPWINTSAGPNHPWSLWGSAKDILGYALNIPILLVYCGYAWTSGQRWLALWLAFVSHLLMPVALILWYRGMRFPLGRLAVLAKDGGGKRRIVGVVDYWSQWALKSLHLYLFDVLRKIPQDGTFDQMAPIRALLDYSRLGYPSFSFDLSNATDRLPVALQEQILGLLSGSKILAMFWRLLMTHRAYVNSSAGSLKYAVGQPMGALSSWAILAFTHHIIVQVAAYRSGWKGWFPLYAVLGDDVVILTREVANEYVSIMRYLGVPINQGKSIISESGLLEFAKRVMSPHLGDLSAVSGRELLRFVRSRAHTINLFTHLMNLGFVVFPYQGLEMVKRLGSDLRRFPPSIVLASAYVRSRLSGACRLPSSAWPDEWFRLLHGSKVQASTVATVDTAWLTESVQQACLVFRGRALSQLQAYLSSWYRYPLFKGTLGGILSIPLLLISPAAWSHLLALSSAVIHARMWASKLSLEMYTQKEWGAMRTVEDGLPRWLLEFTEIPLPVLEAEEVSPQTARQAIDDILRYQVSVLKMHRAILRDEAWYNAGFSRKITRSGLALPAPRHPSKVSEMQGGAWLSHYF